MEANWLMNAIHWPGASGESADLMIVEILNGMSEMQAWAKA
jgi:hypothetical protein